MSNLRMLGAVLVAALGPLGGGASQATAQGVLDVIDIRPILARHDVGNSRGLAFNPDLSVLYLSHGSDNRGSFVYTINLAGELLTEWDFGAAYRPGSLPQSLSYERASGHLFIFSLVPTDATGSTFTRHLVEMTPDGSTIFSDLIIDQGDGMVRDDGIWERLFGLRAIRHLSRDGVFVEDIPLGGFPDGFPGPFALTSSFAGGFFIVDHFGRRLVEVDGTGKEIAEASTFALPGVDSPGRAFAIDTDGEQPAYLSAG